MSESLDVLVGELQATLIKHREKFVAYLQERAKGTISVEGPVMYVNGKYEEEYCIRLDETELGKYKVEYVLSDEEIKDGADGKPERHPPRILSATVIYRGTVPRYEHPLAKYLRLEGRENDINPDLSIITVHCHYDRSSTKSIWRQPMHGEIPFRVEQ